MLTKTAIYAIKEDNYCILQVSVSFNVEAEPSNPAFNLTAEVVDESLSFLVVKACAK